VGAWTKAAGERVAFITGGGNGIGAATAEELAARGWSVAIADLDHEAARAVAERCGERALALEADVTSYESVEAAVAAAVERFGGIDLCFANAGIATEGTLRHTHPDVFAVQVDVNLCGAFRTVRACLPHLIRSRGYVLVNASASALGAPPGLGAYGASKAGAESLGDTLRREVRHLGVDVGVVYLLWVGTDMVRGAERQGEVWRAIRGSFRGPLSRVMPVRKATDAIVRGIERRSRRVVAPRYIGALYRIRGVAPSLFERDMVRMAPAVDAASERQLRDGGREGAVRTDTPATAAAARAVQRRPG
jgi:NAD(P)-dependent dehydrogenase (short-subunit alcohol dehydrogenase family)